MQVDFYQLSRDPVERAVAQIAGRVLEQGERLLVVAGESERRAAVGEALWSAGPERFLANGEAGGAHDARQPVLLSERVVPANGARCVALADGVWREEVLAEGAFDRVFLFFDDTTVVAARGTWRALGTHEGLARQFHQQIDGKWVLAG